jgi:hypothetical protein
MEHQSAKKARVSSPTGSAFGRTHKLHLTSHEDPVTVFSHTSEGGSFGNTGFPALMQYLNRHERDILRNENEEMRRAVDAYHAILERQGAERKKDAKFPVTIRFNFQMEKRNLEDDSRQERMINYLEFDVKAFSKVDLQIEDHIDQKEIDLILLDVLEKPDIYKNLNKSIGFKDIYNGDYKQTLGAYSRKFTDFEKQEFLNILYKGDIQYNNFSEKKKGCYLYKFYIGMYFIN